MCIKGPSRPRQAGMLLAEALIAIGVTALLVLAIITFSVFTGRSFAALYNYVELDDDNRIAMDQITRDVRQANRVLSWTTTSLSLEAPDPRSTNNPPDTIQVDFTYRPDLPQKPLLRIERFKNGVVRTSVLLKECQRLAFAIGQRNTVAGAYDVYPAATAATAKVVNVSWVCSRQVPSGMENTESVQTARIVIRKQGV